MSREVPLFPLGSVLFPGLVLPLHIFEDRYRALVRDLLKAPPEDRVFAVVAIRSGHEVGPGAARALHAMGCLARLQAVSELPDGRYDITAVGTTRFHLRSVVGDGNPAVPDTTGSAASGPEPAPPRHSRRREVRDRGEAQFRPYLTATIDEIAEDDGEAAPLLAPAVGAEFTRYREALGVSPVRTEDLDARLLSYIVSSAVLLDQVDRQSLLEAADTTERLRLALRLLRREAVMLRELGAVPATDAARMAPGLN